MGHWTGITCIQADEKLQEYESRIANLEAQLAEAQAEVERLRADRGGRQ